jgi:hypothetical protein
VKRAVDDGGSAPGAWILGVAAGAAVTVVAYAFLRVIERLLFAEPNPAMLLWADPSPFVWRSVTALYLGGAGAFGGYALASRSARAAGRGLLAAVTAAVAAILVQGALFP